MKLNIPLTTIATGLSLLSGIIYIFGLWITFDLPASTLINFLSFSDVIKASLYPLLFISMIVFIDIPKFIKMHNEETTVSESRIALPNGRKTNRIYVLAPTFICVSFLYIYAKDFPNIASFCVLFITYLAIYYIRDLDAFITIKSNLKNHSLKIMMLIPFFAFNYGIRQSASIKNHPDVIVFTKDSHCGNKSLAFIATYSDKVFAYNKENNTICIMPADSVELGTPHPPSQSNTSQASNSNRGDKVAAEVGIALSCPSSSKTKFIEFYATHCFFENPFT